MRTQLAAMPDTLYRWRSHGVWRITLLDAPELRCDRYSSRMLSGLQRIRHVVGAWLRLREARYNVAANALELLPGIQPLQTQAEAQMLAQQHQFEELRAAIAELRELQDKH